MTEVGVLVNLVMAALNLFPMPPLDGGRMLVAVLPYAQARAISRIEPYGFFVVLFLAATNVLGYWMRPVLSVLEASLDLLLRPLALLLT
jgi:Zn-dependent protease